MFSQNAKENREEFPSEVLSQKSRHLSTISYSLEHKESTLPSRTSDRIEYSPTSTVDIRSSCYPNIAEQYYVSTVNSFVA